MVWADGQSQRVCILVRRSDRSACSIKKNISTESVANELVEVIIQSSSASLITHLAKTFLEEALDAPENAADAILVHLENIMQRYPSLFREVADDVATGGDDVRKNRVEQITIRLTLGFTSKTQNPMPGNAHVDAVVASSNADEKIRVGSLNTLLALDTQTDDVESAILARVHDTSTAVLETLYSPDYTPTLLRILRKSPKLYLNTLHATLSVAKPKRAVLKLHISFLLDEFLRDVEDVSMETEIAGIVLPFLLYSKPRQHTAEGVWGMIDKYLATGAGTVLPELLKGTQAARNLGEEDGDDVERMGKLNDLVTKQIAGTSTVWWSLACGFNKTCRKHTCIK